MQMYVWLHFNIYELMCCAIHADMEFLGFNIIIVNIDREREVAVRLYNSYYW